MQRIGPAWMLLTGADLPSWSRVVWRFVTAVILLECLSFGMGLLPDAVAHWLLLRTRVLVLLGPPLGFSSFGMLSFVIGMVGSLAFLVALRKSLGARRRGAVGWAAASLGLWLVLGLAAAAPLV